MERHIARTFIYPALLKPVAELHFNNQLAFIATGSTTAAVIAILQAITDMLSCHSYVHLIALGFSKPFDTVRPSTLLEKLIKLDLPVEAYDWLKDFFDGQSHCIQLAGDISTIIGILANVILGSAIGPLSGGSSLFRRA